MSLSGLTPRERACLAALADGKTRREIAALLFIEPTTVRSHLHTLYRKLGVSNTPQAVAEAFHCGWLLPRWLKERREQAAQEAKT